MASVGELLAALKREANQTPPEGSRVLSICGLTCGTLVPHAYEVLRSPTFYDVFEQTDKGLELSYGGNQGAHDLADLAEQLHEGRLISQWRNELLDVVPLDFSHTVTKAERGVFRFLGLSTTCVHALATDDSGRFWIARRSETKQVDPGFWDTLSGGLMSAGETLKDTLARETFEEAGLMPDQYSQIAPPITFLVTRPVRDGWMRERTVAFPVKLKSDAIPTNRDGEVAHFEAVKKSEVLHRIEQKRFTLGAALAFLYAFQAETSV
ncbi:MAG TPA: NUDIX hydrolase [Sutterella sp.]|nr:NUDIX hydrolase [Sutterella sp.]